MYPLERSLVNKYKDRPFALLGVNTDPKETLRELMKDGQVTWRSWWDGGRAPGPISMKWNVWSFPAIYVLDAKGVIRFKNVHGDQLEAAIDSLLKEQERSPGVPRGRQPRNGDEPTNEDT